MAALGYLLGELPNSFIKRQLSIDPGEAAAAPLQRRVFLVLDQIDSAFGVLLALSLCSPITWQFCLVLLLVGAAVHLMFNVLPFALGVKKRPA
jgi:hypothetical protein